MARGAYPPSASIVAATYPWYASVILRYSETALKSHVALPKDRGLEPCVKIQLPRSEVARPDRGHLDSDDVQMMRGDGGSRKIRDESLFPS